VIYAPQIDTQATLQDVRECVAEAGKAYELFAAKDRLQFTALDDYNRFSPETQQAVYARLKELMAGEGATKPAQNASPKPPGVKPGQKASPKR
jgi:hypothetical protein